MMPFTAGSFDDLLAVQGYIKVAATSVMTTDMEIYSANRWICQLALLKLAERDSIDSLTGSAPHEGYLAPRDNGTKSNVRMWRGP
jgi:hypothetical protein